MASAEERKKLAAEQYLAENRVRWLLENVTADLIRFTPSNPYKFITQRVKEIQEQGAVAMHRHRVVAIIGGPACGKGVVCAYLAQELGTVTVAPAELLRNEVKEGTEMGKRVGELLHANSSVPKEFITELTRKKLNSFAGNPSDAPTYVLDGFPRALDQTLHFEEHAAEVSKAIFLNCPESVLRARMTERRSSDAADDDDSDANQDKKLLYHNQSTLPVVEYFRALGKLHEVDASQRSEAVQEAVWEIVRK